MLSVIYNLASAAIVNRIKPHLDHIFEALCGFVPDRYIGECTRLIFDIMKFTKDRTLPGMLVLIDFEKGFTPSPGLLSMKQWFFLVFQRIL